MKLQNSFKEYIEKVSFEVRTKLSDLLSNYELTYEDIMKYITYYNGEIIESDSNKVVKEDNKFVIYTNSKDIEDIAKLLGYVFIQEDTQICEYFARAFLMPKQQFLDVVFENSYNTVCNYAKVAKKFNLQESTIIQRGIDLEIWEKF